MLCCVQGGPTDNPLFVWFLLSKSAQIERAEKRNRAKWLLGKLVWVPGMVIGIAWGGL